MVSMVDLAMQYGLGAELLATAVTRRVGSVILSFHPFMLNVWKTWISILNPRCSIQIQI